MSGPETASSIERVEAGRLLVRLRGALQDDAVQHLSDDLLRRLDFDVRPVPLVDGVSSSAIRALVKTGEIDRAARML